MGYRHLVAIIGSGLLLTGLPAGAQQENGPVQEDELVVVREFRDLLRARLAEPVSALDIDLIMEGADFTGSMPASVRWHPDGGRLWFEWKRWDEPETGTWEYDVVSGSLTRLSDDAADGVPAPFAVWDRDHRRAAWTAQDRVLVLDGRGTRTVVSGLEGARPVAFAADGRRLVLEFGGNLLALVLEPTGEGPTLARLTDIRAGREPDPEPPTASQRWLRDQQLALFDVLSRREQRRLERRDRDDALQPAVTWLEGWELASLTASPDLRWVTITARKDAADDRTADVPDYVTTSGYTEDLRTRVKVGDDVDGSKVGLIEVATGRVTWAAPDLGDRSANFGGALWSDDSARVLVHVRADDNKDRWFAVLTPRASDDALAVDTAIGAHDLDDAWINWSVARGYGWLPGGQRFYYVSERDGSMHLYTADAAGGDPTALTSGDFEVFSPRLTPSRDAFVFEASVLTPFDVQTYRLPLDGGVPEALTGGHGRSNSTLAPDGARLAAVSSSPNRPWELYVRSISTLVDEVRVTDSPSPAFASYDWAEPEIIRFTASDGVEVPARIYVPDNPHPARPAVIFVHGAGYLQNVHRWWSSYSREYTFHHLLMERGYTVLDIDYRGSAGYGREWRTAIYRHMGGRDLQDQIDGAAYLAREHGIDPERIGIYGGSYGGFITLMALFTAGDRFAAGAALRPVTDWAHYNHPYTSNILNAPHEDAESYWRSSPIYFAEGLEDPLLICHGVIDTNVHFQGVVRLAQRLIELRKENWEVALYPVERHGFVESASWADEYRRILALFEGNLK